MQKLLLPVVLAGFLFSGVAFGQPDKQEPKECEFNGLVVPCAVAASVGENEPIDLQPIPFRDWAFDEKDMARDATTLHAEFINNPTWGMAQRYALSEIYRQYRVTAAMKLATYARYRIMEQAKAKYGDIGDAALAEAVVLEAGMPVVQVPDLIKTLTPGAMIDLMSKQGLGK